MQGKEKDMKLTIDDIKNISSIKEEPNWMLNFRLKCFEHFINTTEPNFGPKPEFVSC